MSTPRLSIGTALHINAPAVFRDPAFIDWLNNGSPKFTWHQGGAPNEFSDVIVMVDPSLSGEGSDSDMPEHIWGAIVQACRDHIGQSLLSPAEHICVRLTNVAD